MTASCPGFATYSNLSNGQVEVNGAVPSFSSAQRVNPLIVAWQKYGRDIARTSRRHGIPAAWLVGIMMAESKGNQFACAPCSLCSASLCATGAGQQCCAFGLMQFIAPTAEQYGATPDMLMRNPSTAIELGGQLVSDLSERVGFDLVRIAAAYNGGLNRCGKSGTTFGWFTNGDYPMLVAQYANTYVNLGLPTPLGSSAAVGVFLATVGVGVATMMYMGKL